MKKRLAYKTNQIKYEELPNQRVEIRKLLTRIDSLNNKIINEK